MTMPKPFRFPVRRRTLLGSMLAGLPLMAPAGAVGATDAKRHAIPEGINPADIFHDREAAAEIGRAVLQQVPAATLHPLPARTRIARWLRLPVSGPQRRRLSAQVREDFAAGRTVMVNGWTLSLTEARLCACLADGT